ncbi:hypothetical protein HJC23_001875 [Cyclotella cryptica]|uniref:MATH domain-containing protein n=1 Tax=Cyclotella cryptica TaxID=29204 RepID=A0ABD3PMX3_9STRA
MRSKPVCLHFEFNSFRDLPSKIDDVIESEDKTDSNGNTWKVQLYPGGCSDAVDQGMIALILLNTGDTDVDAKFSFIVRNDLGYAVRTETDNAFHCFPSHGREGYGYGYSDTTFIKRSRIIEEENEILINKALHIDVSIQVKVQKEELYRPQTPHTHNMLAC